MRCFFFFQAEDGIRDKLVTGVQTCALPISYERLTFAGGTASFDYDTLRKRNDFAADVAGLYQKRVENPTNAWGWEAGAHVVAGLVNPDGAAQSRGAELVVTGDGEVWVYSGTVYGDAKTA